MQGIDNAKEMHDGRFSKVPRGYKDWGTLSLKGPSGKTALGLGKEEEGRGELSSEVRSGCGGSVDSSGFQPWALCALGSSYVK